MTLSGTLRIVARWEPRMSRLATNYRRFRGVVVLVVVSAAVDVSLVAKYVADDALLENLVELEATAPPSEKVVALVAYMERHVERRPTTDASFLPGLTVLRPTARQVFEKGGDCADRSRLLIELLKREGVVASKVALYDRAGVPRHAVVEVDTEHGSMAVDALYGMYFPKPGGGYYSVWDINRDESILAGRVRELAEVQPAVREYPLETYTYVSPRTINWDKSATMRLAYRGLRAMFGSSVDRWARPSIVEDPVLLSLTGAAFGQSLLIGGTLILPRVRSRRRWFRGTTEA
jgi:hypothetical protein